MRLEHWYVTKIYPNPYVAPELAEPVLCGFAFDRPDYPDGWAMTTSRLLNMVGDTVTTVSGSKYVLGEVDPAYEKKFPGAKDRLRASLPALHWQESS